MVVFLFFFKFITWTFLGPVSRELSSPFLRLPTSPAPFLRDPGSWTHTKKSQNTKQKEQGHINPFLPCLPPAFPAYYLREDIQDAQDTSCPLDTALSTMLCSVTILKGCQWSWDWRPFQNQSYCVLKSPSWWISTPLHCTQADDLSPFLPGSAISTHPRLSLVLGPLKIPTSSLGRRSWLSLSYRKTQVPFASCCVSSTPPPWKPTFA